MPRPELREERRIDWREWLALAWAVGLGWMYARMVVEERAPGLARAVGRYLGW